VARRSADCHPVAVARAPGRDVERRDGGARAAGVRVRYPGASVDTPNHLYSFSFITYDWSKYFALRDELHSYLEHVADSFDLKSSIRFGTEVAAAVYEAEAQRWAVTVKQPDGSTETLHPTVVISGTGIFNPLKYPNIDGLERFEGPAFHTAQWPTDLDLTGKRVAIIGNGASAMQVGPEIQDIVGSLTIFQRSPQWAAPFEQFRKEAPGPNTQPATAAA
jgi:4-hydroxyacetophenone monooxygenase